MTNGFCKVDGKERFATEYAARRVLAQLKKRPNFIGNGGVYRCTGSIEHPPCGGWHITKQTGPHPKATKRRRKA